MMNGLKSKMEQTGLKYVIFADGLSPHTYKWARELNKHFELFVVSSTEISEQLKSLLPKERLFSLQIQVKAEGGTTAYLKKVFQLRKLLKKIAPDFVNAHYISSHGFIIALIKKLFGGGYNFIASAWGSDVLVFPFRNKIFKGILKFVLSSADYVTSDSEYMSSVIKSIKKRDVLTFTFGLDKMPELEIEEKSENLFFSNRALTPNYNIDMVIRHFAKIAKQNEKARLVISNNGSEKEKLLELSKELKVNDKVEFVGFLNQADQKELYNQSAFYFSLPSSDSTSVSLLEALAYGCIPILSDIPANREWIKNEETGLLLKNEIPYNKLSELLKKQSSIIKANRQKIEKKAIFPNLINEFVKTILT